jgi:hypothetical protein
MQRHGGFDDPLARLLLLFSAELLPVDPGLRLPIVIFV